MLRSPLVWKLYAGLTVLILLTTAIVGFLVASDIEKDSLDEIRISLNSQAILLKEIAGEAIATSTEDLLQKKIEKLGSHIGLRFTVIGFDGKVLADSEKNPALMDNHADRPEVLAAHSHGKGVATRFSNTLGTEMMYLAMPIKIKKAIKGYVRVAIPLTVIDERLAHLRGIIFIGGSVALFVVLVIGFFFARNFLQPVISMIAVAGSIADGDYTKRVSISRKDELGKLAEALNRMAESSKARMEMIETDRNKLHTILAGMVEGVVAIDIYEKIVHINASAGEILNAAPEESIGKAIWEVSRVSKVSEALGSTINTGAESRERFVLLDRDSEKIVEMHSSSLKDGDGNSVGALVVLHDVSELHKLETVRRDFVANVSHELKTPITAIRGMVETILDDSDMKKEKMEKFLVKAKDQSIRLSALVSDLLTISRLESEDQKFNFKNFDIGAKLTEVVRTLQPTADIKNIAIQTNKPETSLKIHGDEDGVSQVIYNLLDNALKYSPTDGTVIIKLSSLGGDALLEVIDSGIGIEPQHRYRIFERFYRVDKARSRELGGTGLGLSIVKHIVLAHDGKVSVEGADGGGTLFRVSFPLSS